MDLGKWGFAFEPVRHTVTGVGYIASSGLAIVMESVSLGYLIIFMF